MNTFNNLPARSVVAQRGGFTLAEALFALVIAAVALSGIMLLNSQSLRLIRSSRMTNAATLSLQERVEQMRIANWKNITDATFIRDSFFASRPQSSAPLPNLTETLKLSSYPDPTAITPLEVQRTPQGTTIISDGPDIFDETLVRVDLKIDWTGEGGRPRSRESSTILSKVGVSSVNLAWGNGAFDPVPTASPSASPTSSPSASPSPTASASPSPTASPTASPTPNNNGNGNGRGNVNGKTGKG